MSGWRKKQIADLQAGADIHAGDGGYRIGNAEDHATFVAERNKSLMFDYHEAIRRMHEGAVVKYIGTVNGNVMSNNGASFCMCRGCVFLYDKEIKWNKLGYMVYDPDFRYMLTGETVDPRAWKPEKKTDRRDIKSKLGYSRIGLGNV